MLACRSLLQCPQQGGAGLSCLRYTCLVFTVRFLESSSRTPSTSARSHQRASRGEGPCACSLYYFLKCHSTWYWYLVFGTWYLVFGIYTFSGWVGTAFGLCGTGTPVPRIQFMPILKRSNSSWPWT